MSTTYLTERKRPSWCKAISSAILDALMPSTDSNDKEKPLPEKQNYLTKSSLKRPAEYDGLVSPNLRFTPPQLLKIKRNLSDKSSADSSSEATHSSSSESSSSVRKIKRIEPSLNSRYSSLSSEKQSSTSLDTSSGTESQDTAELSAYSTPERISTTIRSLDCTVRPWKRSVEGPSSTNSSPNSSLYFTPEGSPSEWGSAVKRQRINWNDSYNNDSNNSGYLNESFRSCDSPGAIQPELIGYQMVGDSQFCRFGQQILGLRRVSMPNCPGRIGICVSGQTIPDLHRRVKDKFYPISDKIILMIGTNDFLRNTDVTTMCHELSELIKTLQQSASNIVLLTLPPIPKLEKKHSIQHFMMLDKYNRYIRSLEDGDKIKIADVSHLYMSTPPYQRCRIHLFEIYFPGAARRHDLIHLNRQGLEVIRNYILEHFL